MDFSLWWLLLLQSTGSQVLAQQLWCMGLVALQHMGSFWTRDRTMSPVLAVGFLTTGPTGPRDQGSPLYHYLSCLREKAMAPHSNTLAWKIPWTEEPGRLQSMGSLESDTTEQLYFHFSLLCIGEGNGNPLQYSCLENPRDGGAW